MVSFVKCGEMKVSTYTQNEESATTKTISHFRGFDMHLGFVGSLSPSQSTVKSSLPGSAPWPVPGLTSPSLCVGLDPLECCDGLEPSFSSCSITVFAHSVDFLSYCRPDPIIPSPLLGGLVDVMIDSRGDRSATRFRIYAMRYYHQRLWIVQRIIYFTNDFNAVNP